MPTGRPLSGREALLLAGGSFLQRYALNVTARVMDQSTHRVITAAHVLDALVVERCRNDRHPSPAPRVRMSQPTQHMVPVAASVGTSIVLGQEPADSLEDSAMTSHCDHGTPLDEDCGKCREIVDAMKRNANAFAFPTIQGAAGITKREWFAGLAMQGFAANGLCTSDEEVAANAVSTANALLKELAK